MLETLAPTPASGKNTGSGSRYAFEQNVAVAPTPAPAPAPEKWSGSSGFGCKSLPPGVFSRLRRPLRIQRNMPGFDFTFVQKPTTALAPAPAPAPGEEFSSGDSASGLGLS